MREQRLLRVVGGLALAGAGCGQEFVIAILDGSDGSDASTTSGHQDTSTADGTTVGIGDATAESTDEGPPRTSAMSGPTDDGTTAATDATVGSSSDGTGPGECPPVEPGEGTCPAECTGDCTGGTCTITCGVAECNGGTILCPDGWPCVIDCTADNSCANATIECGDRGCEIVCEGLNSCLASTVVCGPQACTATCSRGAGMLEVFECAACSCENLGC